jgi:exopolysaccharide biosynthesis protein
MFERHPRAAIGWNQNWYFLVEVDGRQRGLSVGMTLDELSSFMMSLGCEEAMNCDGGGSATLWFEGEVRNSPCDRAEREIANSLVIAKRKAASASPSASAAH